MDTPADGPHLINGQPRFVIDGVPYPVHKCRLCGRNIALVPTRRKKLQPRDADGRVHFATCPARHRRRKKRSPQPKLPLI